MTSTFYKQKQKGFTLIELLVVIALLGIMTTIVLAALGTSKSKGDDSAIQTTMKNVQNQAGIYLSQNASYGAAVSSCAAGIFADTTSYGLSKLVAAIQAKSSSTACFTTLNPTAWVMSAQMKSDTTKYWCVDSLGQSRLRTQAATSTASSCSGY